MTQVVVLAGYLKSKIESTSVHLRSIKIIKDSMQNHNSKLKKNPKSL